MSDLGLDTVRTRGRAPVHLTAELVREIIPADLELLAAEKGSKTPALKRLSDRHHALARALASGLYSPGEAALMTGYDPSRVSILQGDPTFQELLAFYRAEKDRAFSTTQDKLASVAGSALDEIQTRLEDEPEKLSVGQLIQLAALGADRTGNGPTSTQTLNVNDNTAQRLKVARERLDAKRKEIEG